LKPLSITKFCLNLKITRNKLWFKKKQTNIVFFIIFFIIRVKRSKFIICNWLLMSIDAHFSEAKNVRRYLPTMNYNHDYRAYKKMAL